MLSYVSSGPRDFGEHPVAPHRRDCWEFYAVLRGRVAPFFPGDDRHAQPPLSGESLWVFAPENEHGWRGETTRPARIAVFHFQQIAPALAQRIPTGGHLRVPLDKSRSRTLARLARELQPLLWQSGELVALRGERSMLDLCLLTLESLAKGEPQTATSAAQKVKLAEQWFSSHLEQKPTLVSISCRLGLSPAQMRRIFVAERGLAPKAAFEEIRLARAEKLLAGSNLKLEAVASTAGYPSASVFVQAFRRARGITPDVWRRTRAG